MDVKVGDRVSIDGLKVGQQPRTGTIRDVSTGLSGVRYTVEWDDGHSSTFAPSGGNLVVLRRGANGGRTASKPAKAAAPKAKPGKTPSKTRKR